MKEELEQLKQIFIDSYENNLPILNTDTPFELIDKIAIQMDAEVIVPEPNTTCENLVAKLDEYIKLLTDEIGEFAPYLFIHGIGSTRVEEGIKLREEIKELRNKFEQREA